MTQPTPTTLPGSSMSTPPFHSPETSSPSPPTRSSNLSEASLRQQLTSPSNSSSRPSRWIKRVLVLLLLGGLLTGGVLAREQLSAYSEPWLTEAKEWIPFIGAEKSQLEGIVTDRVQRGPFRITVTERGTLDSLKNVVLTSKVEGTTTIISIVPEGSYVQVGDLVCELDSSTLIEKETQQQIQVTQADSALQSAKEAVEIQKTQNDSDIAAAQLKLTLARLDLEKFEMGDLEQQRAELASQVTLSKEKVAQAEETYEFTSRLVKKGYKTQSELESARITQQTESLNLQIAAGKLDLLEKYDKTRTLTELRANSEEFERELDRVRRKAAAALTQAEAELSAKRLTYDVELSKHLRLKEQIDRCKIYATQDGQVIYANNRDGRGSDQVLIEEGSTVRERQPIVNLPDLSEMKVNARIHESRISMIRPGLSVAVKVDAFGGQIFPGRVETVASVPSSTGNFMTRDLKEYEAVIRILGTPSDVSQLRPGLTAELEVLVNSRDNVVQAPIQSIVSVVGKQVAFVVNGPKADLRMVKIGQSNDRMIEILEGLEAGDIVVMNPKTSFDRQLKALETELIAEQAKNREESESLLESTPALPDLPAPTLDSGRKPGVPGAPGEFNPAGPRGSEENRNGTAPAGSDRRGSNPLAFFERMDLDQDGRLADSEMVGNMKERMMKYDADGDGFINRDEFQKGMAERQRGEPEGRPVAEQVGGG